MRLDLNNIKYYQLALVLTLIPILYWQYQIVRGKEEKIDQGVGLKELSFKMNSGLKVSLPDESDHFAVIVFWRLDSENSRQEIAEAIHVRDSAAVDTLIDFYFVNLGDSLDLIKRSIDFEDPTIPYAYDPSGSFLDR